MRRSTANAIARVARLPAGVGQKMLTQTPRSLERDGLGALGVAEPEVDHVQRLQAEVPEVLVDGAAQVSGPPRLPRPP
ncbi:hypothetical protein [Streptosporangium sandarakinum]|uniref:hypothetical protein n=1 Tax=Streptosporangium sandarakinum TaxID=1260955 RepID=UPI00342213B7